MTDYSEEQRNELEALESIYPDSFTGAGPRRGRAGSRRAAGGAGGRGGAAARPAGGRAARLGWVLGMLAGFPRAGKARRSMAPVARAVGTAPAAFGALVQQPARRGQAGPLRWKDALRRSLSKDAALGIGLCAERFSYPLASLSRS